MAITQLADTTPQNETQDQFEEALETRRNHQEDRKYHQIVSCQRRTQPTTAGGTDITERSQAATCSDIKRYICTNEKLRRSKIEETQ